MDPKLEEFTRANDLSNIRFLRQMQQYIREVTQSQLDERDRLIDENKQLRADLDEATRPPTEAEAAGARGARKAKTQEREAVTA